jgi:PAS domain S-box-containing protein
MVIDDNIVNNQLNIDKVGRNITDKVTELLDSIKTMSNDEISHVMTEVNKRVNDDYLKNYVEILSEHNPYKINKIYRVMGQEILRVLSEPIDFSESIQRVLTIIKSSTGVDAVGIRLENHNDYPYFTHDGFSEDFLSKENSLIALNKDGGVCHDCDGNISLECTCGLVISGKIDPENPLFTPGGSSWTNNSFPFLEVSAEDDPRFHPRNTCIHQGYASVALIPIRAKGKIVGLIQLNDRRKDQFTIESIETLEAIAENIGEAMLRKQTEHQMNERMKELKAFYNLMDIVEKHDDSLDSIYQTFIDILPKSWQYPEITGARIIINEVHYKSSLFKETEWMQSERIKVYNEIIGKIDVCYLENRSKSDEGPFLKEERLLISAIADRIGDITQRKWVEKSLRETEERYKSLFNNNYAVILIINPDNGDIQDVNLAACDFYGWSRDEMLRKNISEINIMSKDDIMKAMADSKAKKRNYFIFKHQLSNKEIRDVEVYSGPVKFGTSTMLYSFAHDITDRIRIEEYLRRSNEKHKTIIKTAMDGFWVISVHGDLLEVNETYCRMIGYSNEELLTMNITDIEVIESQEDTKRHLKYIIENGEDRFESRHRCKNGKIIDVEVSIQHRVDDNQMVTFIHDITERKQLEDVQSFLSTVSNGGDDKPFFNALAEFLAVKLGINIVSINRLDDDGLMARTVAIWHDGVLEDNISYSLKDTPYAEVVNKSMCYIQSGVSQLFPNDEVLQSLNAESFAGITLVGHSSQPIGLIALIGKNPLTSQPVIESMLKLVAERAVGEMERLDALDEKNRLESQMHQNQKMEFVGRLAGGIAHDFNNMLCVILGHSEMALEQVDPDDPIFADLKEIMDAAQRSADLTRQLLAFARKQTVEPKLLDLNQTISGMLNMLKRLIGENIDLNWQSEAGLWPIMIDPSQVDQILANLCVNARGAINGVGKIIFETDNKVFTKAFCSANVEYQTGEYVHLAVRDNGCGMDNETLEHIFEPFFTTKGINEGTGLGLSTVYGAIKQNNGFITVNSEVGTGTTFNIYFPRFIGKAEDVETDEKLIPIKRGNETILIVEDEPVILKLTDKVLVSLGYNVFTANSPAEAINVVHSKNGKIDLIITDVIMPGMNGRDLINIINSFYPNIKYFFISGYTADVIAKQGILDQGVNFLQKPFSVKAISDKVYETMKKE